VAAFAAVDDQGGVHISSVPSVVLWQRGRHHLPIEYIPGVGIRVVRYPHRRWRLGPDRCTRSFAMAERKPAKTGTPKAARSAAAEPSDGFTAEERAAMRERAQEVRAAARRRGPTGKADGEADVLAKIAEMPEPDRAMAERLHAIVQASAPELSPRTWYGMPAYAKDGTVLCFFQSAHKFKSRYATFGFTDKANLDEGAMWATSFALKALTPAEEARIAGLVKKAVS
jgi:uncharacterized protein YdhG (YjbR/CyaY superfamily)